jgi:hypothetical protein
MSFISKEVRQDVLLFLFKRKDLLQDALIFVQPSLLLHATKALGVPGPHKAP